MLLGGLGSSSVVSLGLRVYLKDDVSRPAAAIKGVFNSLKSDMDQYKEGLRLAQATYGAMAAAGTAGLIGMTRWVREGAQFGYLIEGVGAVTDATTQEIKQMYDLANKLGKSTMFLPEEVASGMRHLGLAGMTAQETMANIQAAVKLAGASLSELGGKGGAADIMINVMMAWRYHFSQAEAVADKLAIAANKSNLDLFDLAEGLKYVSATARDLNQPLEVVLAQLMMMANVGIKGSMAGTALENMYRYFTRAVGQFKSTRQRTAFEQIGLTPEQVVDAKGNMRPIIEIFDMLKGKVNELEAGNVKLQGWLEAIFGVRGKREASAFLRNLDMVKEYYTMLQQSSGTAGKIMGQMMSTLEGHFKKLSASWSSFKNAFSKSMEPIVKPLLGVLKGILDVLTLITQSWVGKILTPMIVGWLAVKTAIWGVKAAVATLMLTVGRFGAEFTAVSKIVSAGWKTMALNALGYNYAAGYGAYGAGYGVTKKGVLYKKGGPGLGNTFVKKGTKVNSGGLGSILGGIIGGSLTKQGTGALAKGIGGRIFSAIGGWWGIAITAIMALTPVIVDWIQNTKNNNDAIKQNTEALKQKIAQDRASAVMSEYISPTEVQARLYDKTMGEIKDTYTKLIQMLYELGPEAQAWAAGKTPIQIYVDAPYYIQTKREKSDTVRAILNTR